MKGSSLKDMSIGLLSLGLVYKQQSINGKTTIPSILSLFTFTQNTLSATANVLKVEVKREMNRLND